MTVATDAIAALTAAKLNASDAVSAIRDHKRKALDDRDYDEYDRCGPPERAALTAEDAAARRLIAGVINPTGPNVVSLKAAADKLEERIAKFKEDAARLADLAVGLSILTSVIQLFSIA